VNRKIVLILLLAIVGLWFALRSPLGHPPRRAGDLNQADIETEIKEALKLQQVHLVERAPGEFSGTGKASDGTKYKIKVTQSQNKLTWESEDEKGAKVIGSKHWNANE
jgi:hypothetical protein